MVPPMRRLFCDFVLFLALSACGGAKKSADSPVNAEETGDSGTADIPPPADSPPGASGHAPGDDSARKAMPCSGFDIPDLLAALSQVACEVPKLNGGAPKDLKDRLEIRVVPDAPRIAPGGTADVVVTFKNKGKGDLPLDFVIDPEPRFDIEVYTLKGRRADAPPGPPPALPPQVASAEVPEAKMARITLAQEGTAKITLKWTAVKYKWASKERARGALPGHGYPRDPSGPLAKGSYVLRVVTPLTNVFEGTDHEVSQPHAQVSVALRP
jgi:hypothetical protein